MRVDGGSERLPCGVELATLVDQVAEGTSPADPEHQATCPHCGPALAELDDLWGWVRELAREEVVVPARLVEKVIRRIREEVASLALRAPLEAVAPRLVEHALLLAERGATRIADSVVAEFASRAALEVPGVHSLDRGGLVGAIQGRVPTGAAPEGVAVEVEEERVTVHLQLVVVYGESIPDVTNAVRSHVIRSVEAMTGLEVAKVNIAVQDVDAEGS